MTNANTKTVTINATTTGTYPSTLNISNLIVSAPLNSTNTLFLNNAGLVKTGRVANAFTLNSGGALLITNSVLRVDGVSGGGFADDGRAQIDSGLVIITDTYTQIGNVGRGMLTISNGTMLAREIAVGANNGSQGTLTIAGGTNTLSSYLSLGTFAVSTGTIWITGGQLTATNNVMAIGDRSVGQMTVSNGTVLGSSMTVGGNSAGPGAVGTLTVAGGTNTVSFILKVGNLSGSTGAVWVTGGRLSVSNSTEIGNAGVGQMTVSNGTALLGVTFLGEANGSRGTLTVAGGTAVLSSLGIGGLDAIGTGAVWVTGGQLIVTNYSTTVGVSGVGLMTVSNGTVLCSNVVVAGAVGSIGTLTMAGGTNTLSASFIVGNLAGATGAVWMTGGQLTVTNPVLNYIGNSGVGQMTVSNGTVLADSEYVGYNTGSAGTLTVAGGTNAPTFLEIAYDANSTGTVWLTAGQLVVNQWTRIGISGVGRMTVSNGTWLVNEIAIGSQAGSRGELTLAGGTNSCSLRMYLGGRSAATGAVWLTGGQLIVTNSETWIGVEGVGQFTMSNGTWLARDVTVGFDVGSQGAVTVLNGNWRADSVRLGLNMSSYGTLTLAGGTNQISSTLVVGLVGFGTVWVTGGQLTLTNGEILVADGGAGGQMTVSNGTVQSKAMHVGVQFEAQSGDAGTLTVTGGKSLIYSNLTVGNFPCAPTGIVSVVGGELRVTNNAVNATLEVRSGTLTQSGGTLDIDRLVITNACGRFIHAGGTLIIGIPNLAAGLDADGDGLPNDWEQLYGLDPLVPTGLDGPDGDLDGDGQSNLAEFLAGTKPNDPNSLLRITKIAPEGSAVRVTWTTAGGRTNRVLVSSGDAAGGYTNSFSNLSPFIIIPGSGETTTNYPDAGGATNKPARYYRIRLVP